MFAFGTSPKTEKWSAPVRLAEMTLNPAFWPGGHADYEIIHNLIHMLSLNVQLYVVLKNSNGKSGVFSAISLIPSM